MKLNIFFTALLFIGIIAGCSDNESTVCLSNQDAAQIGFYSIHTSEVDADQDTTVTETTIFGLNRSDSLIYDSASISQAYLPLSMMNDTTTFIIRLKTRSDTLHFFTSKELNFISEECGFIFDFTIDSIRYSQNSFIDSAVILNPDVIYSENLENVKVYIR